MDREKRAQLRGLREVRGSLRAVADAPAGVVGADWTSMVELRADDTDPDFWHFNGEASVVEHPYTVYDMFGEFTETVREGAFKRTLANDPLVSFVYMHDLATVMAQTRGRNLDLAADPNLAVRAMLDKSDIDAQRIVPKIKRGDARSMSFAFRVTRDEWNYDYTEREILEVNLHEGDVSVIVTGHGANPAAAGAVREALDFDAIAAFLEGAELTDEQRGVLAMRAAADPIEVPQPLRLPDLKDLEDRMVLDSLAFQASA